MSTGRCSGKLGPSTATLSGAAFRDTFSFMSAYNAVDHVEPNYCKAHRRLAIEHPLANQLLSHEHENVDCQPMYTCAQDQDDCHRFNDCETCPEAFWFSKGA